MKIFVPRFRQDLPQPNHVILDVMFAEIAADDLPRVMEEWNRQKEMLTHPDIKLSFRRSIKHSCHHLIQKHVFMPYLLRPHVTIHCGAGEGNKHVSHIAKKAICETAGLARQYGFNVWYGGGDKGLMGEVANGYLETGHSYPDQYLIQISPADFVKGVNSRNGLRPINEGLSERSDAAIIMPDFVTRRHMLDIMLDKEDAAITGPGDRGSIDEWSDVAVHIKTGLIDTNLYMLNLRFPVVWNVHLPVIDKTIDITIPFLRRGYWDPLKKQLENSVAYGFGKKGSLEKMPFMSSAQEIFGHLMRKLDAEGNNPHAVYERHLHEYREFVAEHSELQHTSQHLRLEGGLNLIQ